MSFLIFNKRLPVRTLLFVTGESALIYLAILLAAFVRFGSTQTSFLSPHVLSRALLIMLICQFCLYYNDLYNSKFITTHSELGLRLIKAIGSASIILACIYSVVPTLIMGGKIFFLSIFFVVLFVLSWRYLYNWVIEKKIFTEKILILGSDDLARKILSEIKGQTDCGYQVAGVISMNSSSPAILSGGFPIFTWNGQLTEMIDTLFVDKIVVAVEEKRGSLPIKELLSTKMKGTNVVQGESFYEELTGKILVENINPSWFIFSDGFRKNRKTQVINRLAGLLMASLSLVLTAPIMAIIAIAIKLDSKGPVVFKQKRCGEGGRTFMLYKFRSMIENAEEITGPSWAGESDARITRSGRILRKYRLDELPQLFNVLKGDMSFVGPRPERPEFVKGLKEIIPYYMERHNVKPGITGWAQVCYRYGASVHDAIEKLKYDLFYVKNMSLFMDLAIIFRTMKIVLQKDGAR
jgi:sugar transferase (PEP-CTERM system associated)